MPNIGRMAGLTGTQGIKDPCRVATTANITLSGEQTIDTVACVAGDRVLVKDQTDQTQNGIYAVAVGAWTREPDMDGAFDVRAGTHVPIAAGSQLGTLWRITSADPITIGTSAITFGIASVAADVASVAASAATATTQAGIATTQAGIATAQAGTATTEAGVATTQAGIATTQAANAAASAAAAAAAVLGDVAAATHLATAKSPLADADEVPVADSASTFSLKKFTLAALKTYMSSLVSLIVSGMTQLGEVTISGATASTGELIVVNGTVVANYTASKSGTTVTATVGTFSAADVDRLLVWNIGASIVYDRILAYISPTQVTVDNSGTIASQAASTFGPPALYVDPVAGTSSGTLVATNSGATGSTRLAAGTTAQRDAATSPANDGYLRFNSTLQALEAWYSSAWNTIATTANAVLTTGAQVIAGIKTFSDTTDASSSTVGGTVVSGGLAVAKKGWFGDVVTVGLATAAAHAVRLSQISSGIIPNFSAYPSAATTSITSATWTKVPANTKEYDTTTAYDAATNYRFQPTVAGYYQVSGTVNFGAVSGMTRVACAIYKNGASFKRGTDTAPSTGTTGAASVSALIHFNGSTDYVELYGNCTATTPNIAGSTVDYTFFQGVLVDRD